MDGQKQIKRFHMNMKNGVKVGQVNYIESQNLLVQFLYSVVEDFSIVFVRHLKILVLPLGIFLYGRKIGVMQKLKELIMY